MKKNIVFFLYNLSMSQYSTEPIVEELIDEFDVYVFHISNLTKDRSRNLERKRNLIKDFDISSYSSLKIIKLLNEINPQTVVFFTYQSKYDFFLLSICKYLKINTILHDHGILYGNLPGRTPLKFTLNVLIRNLVVISNLMLLFVKSRNLILLKEYCSLFIGKNSEMYKKYVSFTSYLIYSKHNFNILQKILSVNNSNTVICGFPFFKDEFDKCNALNTTKKGKAVYLHQPFRKINFADITLKDELLFLLKIKEKISQFNFDLVIRLHPSSEIEEYVELLKDTDIRIDKGSLLECCSGANIIIGHWSTALLIGLPLKIPIIILEYPYLKEDYQGYYSIFKEIGLKLNSLSDLSIDCVRSYQIPHAECVSQLIGGTYTFKYNSECLKKIIQKFN